MPSLIRRLSRGSSWSSDDSTTITDTAAGLSSSGHRRQNSSGGNQRGGNLEPPVLVYHSSARSIVFRDQLRRAAKRSDSTLSQGSTSSATVAIHHHNDDDDDDALTSKQKKKDRAQKKSTAGLLHHDDSERLEEEASNNASLFEQMTVADNSVPGDVADDDDDAGTQTEDEAAQTNRRLSIRTTGFQPRINPLPPLELGPNEEFQPLLLLNNSNNEQNESSWTDAERDVVNHLQNQTAVVKTIKNSEWTTFLQRFLQPQPVKRGRSPLHQDQLVEDGNAFNSFVTSTSLLPANGKKMRCYGSTTQYTTGVVFALPDDSDPEVQDDQAKRTETWAWPAGYAAKTEFNVNDHGRLINGRQDALLPLSVMRQYNDDYLNKDEYIVAGRKTSGLSTIPYNEVFVRIGGKGRIVNGIDVATGTTQSRSLETGVGLPIALFVRDATYGHLISLMRTRARLTHVLGRQHIQGIPLLLITPELGVRVLTDALQGALWKIAAQRLNPFQNSSISYKTTSTSTDEAFYQQKLNELIDFDASIRRILTAEELAHLAGGFGATDESVEGLLTQVMNDDCKLNKQNTDGKNKSEASHMLQDVVNEGLVYAVRSGDYHTARQLLILYSVVASRQDEMECGGDDNEDDVGKQSGEATQSLERQLIRSPDFLKTDLKMQLAGIAAPPPPPLDTDRLRSATNSDGLLAVLGAAQILRVMKDGKAKRRVEEVTSALEEWVEFGQHSVAFRISSWQNQRAAQGDLKIATENHSNFMAFAGSKAITNRKLFAQRLRNAAMATDFTDVRFLMAIHEIVGSMHSPCLRLELLQYVLGLDNRYSIAHVARSIELAATCLGMAAR